MLPAFELGFARYSPEGAEMPQERFRSLCSRCARAKIPFEFLIFRQLLGHDFIGYPVTWKGNLVGLFYGVLTGCPGRAQALHCILVA